MALYVFHTVLKESETFSRRNASRVPLPCLQWAQRLVKEVYGNDYAETHPEAVALKEQIYQVLDAKTKRTVDKRCRKVMDLTECYVAQMPQAQRIFDFLERYYPKLVNTVENPLIPLTRNTVELVIRCFGRHYQNFSASTASRRHGSICTCLS